MDNIRESMSVIKYNILDFDIRCSSSDNSPTEKNTYDWASIKIESNTYLWLAE